MPRRLIRKVLLIGLVVSAAFAAWSWLRPYQWGADPAAQGCLIGCQVKQDRSNYWLDLHLRISGEHDLLKPVRLLTASGRELEPADTTLAGDDEKKISEMWIKFWLDEEDFSGPLELRLNGGQLSVRSASGLPRLKATGRRYFVTNGW